MALTPEEETELAQLEADAPAAGLSSDEEKELAQLETSVGQPAPESKLKQLGRAALESLPVAGSVLGGTVGLASPVPGGALIGAGLGAAGGKSLENAGKAYFFPEEAPKNLQEGLVSTAKEIPIGVTGEMGGQIIGKGISALFSKAASKANTAAVDSAGFMKRDYVKAYKRGGEDRLQEIGGMMNTHTLQDGTPLLSGGDTYKDTAAKLAKYKSEVGSKLSALYQQAEAKMGELATSGNPFVKDDIVAAQINPQQIIDEATSGIQKQFKGKMGSSSAMKTLEADLADIKQNGELIDIAKATEIKHDIDTAINYDKKFSEFPMAQKMLKKVRDSFATAIEKQLDAVDKYLPGEMASSLRNLNHTYGMTAEAAPIALKKAAGEAANVAPSLRETIVGGAGMAAGIASAHSVEDAILRAGLGAGAGVGMNLARTYGNPIEARALYRMGQLPQTFKPVSQALPVIQRAVGYTGIEKLFGGR